MDILINFVNFLIEAICSPIKMLIDLLPSSPFQNINFTPVEPFLGALNWVIPIGDILKILLLWCGAIGAYYIYSIALRWLKAIE